MGFYITLILLLLSMLIILTPLFISPSVSTRNTRRVIEKTPSTSEINHNKSIFTQKKEKMPINQSTHKTGLGKERHSKHKTHTNSQIINGKHTLTEACRLLSISTADACRALNINDRYSNVRLGDIKKELRMEMPELKTVLMKIKPNRN